jgi:hypothetical protein
VADAHAIDFSDRAERSGSQRASCDVEVTTRDPISAIVMTTEVAGAADNSSDSFRMAPEFCAVR